jgi:putative membrane protein
MSAMALLSTWKFDALAIVAGAFALYASLPARSRHLALRPAYSCAAAALVIVAVASPVAVLADGYLFSAHMLQHLLLLLVVPPFVLLAVPPRRGGSEGVARAARRVPLVAWASGVGAMWLWHAPTLCNAASQSALVHRVQEISLLLMGTFFWWPILCPRSRSRLPPLGGVLYLFTACIACTVLGVIVTLSPVEVCSVYLHPTDRLGALPLLREQWGLTPDKDQQLGGLLMWVPPCLIYGAGILGLLAQGYRADTYRPGVRVAAPPEQVVR